MPNIQSKFLPLVGGANDVPDDLYVIHEDGCNFVRLPIAESEDGRWHTVVDVGLRPVEDAILLVGRQPFSFHEFCYEITLMPLDGGEAISTMDREIARKWLPDGFAPVALEVIGACCRSLLLLLEPDYIYRITFMPEPSEEALEKHHFVTKVMESLGFCVLADGTDPYLRKFWLMGAPGVDLPPHVEEDLSL